MEEEAADEKEEEEEEEEEEEADRQSGLGSAASLCWQLWDRPAALQARIRPHLAMQARLPAVHRRHKSAVQPGHLATWPLCWEVWCTTLTEGICDSECHSLPLTCASLTTTHPCTVCVTVHVLQRMAFGCGLHNRVGTGAVRLEAP